MTYLRRPFSSVQESIVTVLVIGWLGGLFARSMLRLPRPDDHYMPDRDFLLAPLILAGIAAAFVAGHIKEQFAESRSHLMPRFRRVHIAVSILAILIVAVIVPAIQTWLAGLRSIGLVASTVLMFGAVFWCVAVLTNWTILQIAIIVSIFSETMTSGLRLIVSGQFEVVAMGILALGSAIIVMVEMYLFRLNEDMPTYHCRPPSGWMAKGRMSRPQPTEGAPSCGLHARFDQWLLERQMAATTQHARRASTSWWSHVCRWQVGMMAGWSASIMALSFFVVALIFAWMVAGKHMEDVNGVFVMMMVSFGLPILAWGDMWRRRVPMVAYELLLPVDRRMYVRQLGMAVAVSQIQLWAGMIAGVALWYFLLARQQFSFANLAVMLGIVTFLQMWFFGVSAWSVCFRNMGVGVGMGAVAIVLATYVAIIPVAFGAESNSWSPGKYMALALAGIMGQVGLKCSLNYNNFQKISESLMGQ